MTGEPDTSMPVPERPDPGPWDPVLATPELAAGSARRTSSIAMRRPGGFEGPITAEIRGRDVVRDATGDERVLDEVRVTAEIEEWSGRLLGIEGHDDAGVDALVGTSIRRGFGRALSAALADELARRTLLASILEDLGGALLVSGYAPLRRGLLGLAPADGAARAEAQQDICAGWASGAPLVEVLRRTGVSAVPIGPVAPPLTASAGWHETEPVEVDTVSRIRSLDVGPAAEGAGRYDVRAHFRDAFEGDDAPMVMHEYVVRAVVGGTEPVIERIAVEPRVLPWRECPSAVGSAERLVATPVGAIPALVRSDLTGTSTCTHLNSTLRSLADVVPILEVLGR